MFAARHLANSPDWIGSAVASSVTSGPPRLWRRRKFRAPLFSYSCKLLLPQLPCFDIHTKHPGVPLPQLFRPLFSVACTLMPSTTPASICSASVRRTARRLSRRRPNRRCRQGNGQDRATEADKLMQSVVPIWESLPVVGCDRIPLQIAGGNRQAVDYD